MNLLMILLTAVGLAMDAFAVSVTSGIAVCTVRKREIFKMALLFGVFQALMPIAGFFLASGFRGLIEKFDHWIAFILLAFIGAKMLIESVRELRAQKAGGTADGCDITKTPEEQASADRAVFGMKRLLILAVATSIDALAVGVSFAFLTVDIFPAAAWIGIVCLGFSFFGGCLGRKLGPVFGKASEIVGGCILIGIGVKIILEHLLS